MDILTGAHPTASILLAAAVVLAILAVFRSLGHIGDSPVMATEAPFDTRVDDSGVRVISRGPEDGAHSGTGSGAMSPGAGTSASPPTSGDCRFEERGLGDGSRPLTDYTPRGTITDPSTFDRMNTALIRAVWCADGGASLNRITSGPHPTTSNDVVKIIRESWTIDHGRFAHSTLDAETRNRLRTEDAAVWMIDPYSVVNLPDGRIGAIVYRKTDVGSEIEWDPVLFANVLIFRSPLTGESAGPVLDEIFQLCNSEGNDFYCDTAFFERARENFPAGRPTYVTPVLVIEGPPPSSPSVTPVPSPETSPISATPAATVATPVTATRRGGSGRGNRSLGHHR